jgi:hypothetical protein
MSAVSEVIRGLTGRPLGVTDVLGSGNGDLPGVSGFYAWWMDTGSIPQLQGPRNAKASKLELLYVGIAPVRPTSTQSIRTRVIGNHLRGNTGSSTFRFSLAALLAVELDLHPIKRHSKVVLPLEENRALSEWQRRHLSLTFAPYPEPWTIEHAVIVQLKPPLNLAGNHGHPNHGGLTRARARFREIAVPAATCVSAPGAGA